ncbi:MAG: hypothetical protein ABJA67_16820 [Chthonomonadales bacterium]
MIGKSCWLSNIVNSSIFAAVGLLLISSCRLALADVTYTTDLNPGSPAETAAVLTTIGTKVDGTVRKFDAGGACTYKIVVPSGCRVIFKITTSGSPKFAVKQLKGPDLPLRIDRAGTNWTIYATAPLLLPPGTPLQFKIESGPSEMIVENFSVQRVLPDKLAPGITDTVVKSMGLDANSRPQVYPIPAKPHISFQTGGSYDPSIAVPADAVFLYSSNADDIRSWIDRGYVVYRMGGFRESKDVALKTRDDIQADRAGNNLQVADGSTFMVPTVDRNAKSIEIYKSALQAGAKGVVPEEPEVFARAGYSATFKKEWQQKYGTAWLDPSATNAARNMSENLKTDLTLRQIDTILKATQDSAPDAVRAIALHSPLNYALWGIVAPHFGIASLPSVQEIIGQVWTGTAKSDVRLSGVRSERLFELAFLEYSSLANLVRGMDKRLWFLLDPVEDQPGRRMEEYTKGYVQTLLASLMFAPVDAYEVLPWPRRIYGKVPQSYTTIINTINGQLGELWKESRSSLDAGTAGIGVFYADSMALQREEPNAADLDGIFALALPFISHGVPVQMLSLDRVPDPGYLDRFKVLMVSYDYLKPSRAAIHSVLANWVGHGGVLMLFGGDDIYNSLPDTWWKRAGYDTPTQELMMQLGLRSGISTIPIKDVAPNWTQVLIADSDEKQLANRKRYRLDLSKFLKDGSVAVRFSDISPKDGWGASLFFAELRLNGTLAAAFRAGSEIETRFLAEEHGSGYNGEARFADKNGYWVYRFDNLPPGSRPELTVDLGNGFKVEATGGGPRGQLLRTNDNTFDRTVRAVRLPTTVPISSIKMPAEAKDIYALANGTAPVIGEAKVGSGSLIYAALPPSIFSLTAQNSRWLRELVRHAVERTGTKYVEKSAMVAKRGGMLGVKTLGQELNLEGKYVNLLSPTLAVEEDPTVPAKSYALYRSIPESLTTPKILVVSGKIVADSERATATAFLVKAPEGTEGVARLSKANKTVVGVKATTIFGEPIAVNTYVDKETLLIRYENRADGVVIRVGWK